MSKQRKNHDNKVDDILERSSNGDSDQLSDEDRERIENAMAFIKAVSSDFPDANGKSAGNGNTVPEGNTVPDEGSIVDTANFRNDGTLDTSQPVVRSDKGLAPESLGRFKISRLLGQGGFASVYLALDPKLNRNVAIKVLKPTAFFSAEASTRFDREAQAAAVLNHPNIIPVFETGAIDNDRYIVSAFSDGITLKQWSEKRTTALDPRCAAQIVSTLADAVEHAHQRGIVHRDLKPANILIETAQGPLASFLGQAESLLPGLIRVTDFGLAKYSDSVDQLETADGAIVGTPAYMSPEQAKGMSDIAASSDIYSLGVILYELLTGKLPIIGQTHIETLLAISKLEPKSPRRINSNVTSDLEAICLKCLSKSPGDRYATAHELAQDLNRWLTGEVVVARRVSPVERVRKWCVRNPGLAIAFVVMSAALALALFQWRVAVSESNRAIAESKRADQSHSMTQDLIDELVTEVANNKKLQPEMRQGFVQRAVDLQVRLLKVAPDDRRVILQTAHRYRQLAVLLAEFTEAELGLEAINQSLDVLEPYLDEPGFAASKTESAHVKSGILRVLTQYDEAEKEILDVEESTPQTLFEQAKNNFQLGVTKSVSGKSKEAVVDLELALTMFTSLEKDAENHQRGEISYQIAQSQFQLACTEMNLDMVDEPKARLFKALSWFKDHMDSSPHGNQERTLINISRCHLQIARIARGQLTLDKYDDVQKVELLAESRDEFDKAADGFRSLVDINPMLNGGWGQLAMVYEIRIRLETEQENLAKAKAVVDKFGKLFEDTPERVREYGIIGRIVGESRLRVAELMIKEGNPEEAVRQLHLTKTLMEALIEKFPGVEKQEAVLATCESMLAVHSN